MILCFVGAIFPHARGCLASKQALMCFTHFAPTNSFSLHRSEYPGISTHFQTGYGSLRFPPVRFQMDVYPSNSSMQETVHWMECLKPPHLNLRCSATCLAGAAGVGAWVCACVCGPDRLRANEPNALWR